MRLTPDTIALVTGANRGLGRAITDALFDAGVTKVYAGARDPSQLTDPRVIPLRLDITDPAQVARAVEAAGDVTLLVNNAGIGTGTATTTGTQDDARREMEVNYFGPQAMARAFAPVLAANGGGAIANVLSVLSWLGMPATGNYSAAKAAAWSMTNTLRTELAGQDTQVLAVHVGYMDTDMAAHVDGPKSAPEDVAAQIVAGVAEGREEVLADQLSRDVKAALPNDLEQLYPGIREQHAATAGAAR